MEADEGTHDARKNRRLVNDSIDCILPDLQEFMIKKIAALGN